MHSSLTLQTWYVLKVLRILVFYLEVSPPQFSSCPWIICFFPFSAGCQLSSLILPLAVVWKGPFLAGSQQSQSSEREPWEVLTSGSVGAAVRLQATPLRLPPWGVSIHTGNPPLFENHVTASLALSTGIHSFLLFIQL